jgi:hypothetical protein
MGMMDKMKGKMDDAKSRMEELKAKEKEGTLDDKAKAELEQLRNRFKR